ncbi:hybrid sensor histidine kinase/response regulator [Dyella sp. 20L07]|uniref:hybrid sensor histidine kinase/response regulator n=1 Tax=Dyella sp. 20L07 TaxID=3384240 RepID=UPI003D29D99E
MATAIHYRKVAITILLFIGMTVSALLAYGISLRHALNELAGENHQQLQLHSLALQRFIDRYRVLPGTLALDSELRAALIHPLNDVERQRINLKLEHANGVTQASTLTLLDRDGAAIAANNWREPESNIGRRFDFRPYFQQATATGTGTFYAMGVSTRVAGYFIAEAVKDTRSQTVGVIVVKVPLGELEREWLHSDGTLLLSDAANIVFLGSRNEWSYRVTAPLSPTDAARLETTRQYEGQVLKPTHYHVKDVLRDSSRLVMIDMPSAREPLLWNSLTLPLEGWTLHLLRDASDCLATARVAAALAAGAWAPMILFGLFLQQRRRLIRHRLRSRAELERLVTHYTSALRSTQDSLVLAAQAAAHQNASLEHLPQGVSVVDADLRLVAWNSRYKDIFKFPPGFLSIGKPIGEVLRYNARRGLLGPGSVEEAIQRRLDHMRSGSAHMFERERPDGSVLEICGNPLPDGGFVTSFANITAYKAAARDLRNLATTLEQRIEERTRDLNVAKAEAEHANRSKTRFVTAAVHDLLQPLNAARMYIGVLRGRLVQADSRELAYRVESALEAQDELLASLLDIAQLESGALPARLRDMPLEPLLNDLARQFGILAQSRGLSLSYVPSHTVVRSDPLLLRRILQNFLSNAIHYTPRGRVLLGCRRNGNTIRIEVWDTGVGIPATKQQAIFEEFRRLDTGLNRDSRSAGLGLSIVDRIARLLDHRIALRSWLDRGSVFSVTVPLGDPAAVVTGKPPAAATDDDSPLRGCRVWCIDDAAQARTAIATLLQHWGCEATLIENAQQALQVALKDQPPDLLLIEYQLGISTSLELLPRLVECWGNQPPTIVLTAQRDTDIRARAQAAGLRFLPKPAAPAALRALMSQLLLAASREH